MPIFNSCATRLASRRRACRHAQGFGNRFRKWCIEAGLPQCSVHGLRKAASRLAELGCSEFEIMAVTGHRTSKEVTPYARAVNQKTRATSAMKRLSGERS